MFEDKDRLMPNSIGQHTIERTIGTGGMGTVYAVRSAVGRIYALKVLHEEFARQEQFCARFQNEARMMSELGAGHPHILEVDDFRQEDNGVTWMRMPLIEGIPANESGKRWVTLRDQMDDEKQLALPVIREVVDQLLDAVSYAHERGILHRDLKPANLLLTEGGVLIGDFGLGKAIEREDLQSRLQQSLLDTHFASSSGEMEGDLGDIADTLPEVKSSRAEALIGTVQYMAHELRPPAFEEHTVQSDLYAIGLMVYQMLTGEIEPGIGDMPSDDREALSGEMDRWVGKAMAKKANKRFETALSMKEAWRSLPEFTDNTVISKEANSASSSEAQSPRINYDPSTDMRSQDQETSGNFAGDFPNASAGEMEGLEAGESRVFGGIEFVWCPPGEFLMGSPESEEGRQENETQHLVKLTHGFWLARTQCTQAQWRGATDGNPGIFIGDDLPVEHVSWDDAREWLEKMNGKHTLEGGWEWVLPTEAQWEYACRAGTAAATAFGNSLSSKQANFNGKHPYGVAAKGPFVGKTVRVGNYEPNDWGVFGMHGNVWEWCQDLYGEYPACSVTDPKGSTTGPSRVCRGGGWGGHGHFCRSAYRGGFLPGDRDSDLSFRPALSCDR